MYVLQSLGSLIKFQSLDSAIVSDPQMLKNSLNSIDLFALLEGLVKVQYDMIGSPLKSLSKLEEENLTDKDNLIFVKQRRLIASLLIILFKDFTASMQVDQARQQTLIRIAWKLSLNNLIYLQPFFQERVLFADDE